MINEDQEIEIFIQTIKQTVGYDFTDYSTKSLKRRLSKVLVDNDMDIVALSLEIKKNYSFAEKIVKDVTVNTTELFRDPTIWQHLRYRVLPMFKNQSSINIWHAGCSTGQEVYSMIILLNEMDMLEKAKIYGSDLNADVLEIAKKGSYKYRFNIGYLDNFDKVIRENLYNYDKFNEVPYEKYFLIDKNSDQLKIKPEFTEKPVFKKHDLVKDSNIFHIKFDIILCRNVIIYFNYNLQNRVFDLFHQNMYENACLVLGLHETILGHHTSNFEKKEYIYIKKLN